MELSAILSYHLKVMILVILYGIQRTEKWKRSDTFSYPCNLYEHTNYNKVH